MASIRSSECRNTKLCELHDLVLSVYISPNMLSLPAHPSMSSVDLLLALLPLESETVALKTLLDLPAPVAILTSTSLRGEHSLLPLTAQA